MTREETKSKVLAWAIGVIDCSELEQITDDQWKAYADLMADYLAGNCCAMGWNNLVYFRMQEVGCSRLVADMFSWARNELVQPGSVDWLRKKSDKTIGQSNVKSPAEQQAWLKESGAADVLGDRDSLGGEIS